MIKIKALNKTGIELFHNLIETRRDGGVFEVNDILSDPANFDKTPFKSEIDPSLNFKDRYELAKYLASTLSEFDDYQNEYGSTDKDEYGKSAGLWSWLALVYFDQLSPLKPSRAEHYIYSPHLFESYRHSVFIPFKLYKRFKENSRVFINNKIDTFGQIAESTLSRDYLMNSAPAVKLISQLYGDPDNDGIAKAGASSQPSDKILTSGKFSRAGYGGIERFVRVIQRLKLTYHVQSLTTEALLDLMGNEFKQWVE